MNVMTRLRVSAFICGSALVFSSSAAAEVTVKDAWVRGTVPAQKATGAFLTLTSTVDAKLLSAKTPIADRAEIHKTENHGGMMHMDAVEAVPLPANQEVKLAPGGYHVMIMGLKKPVTAEQKVPLTLTIEEKGGAKKTVEVLATVRPLGQ